MTICSTYTPDQLYSVPIMAIRKNPEAIDLGLPSGTLWADRNVGAIYPEDVGLSFTWGETTGYKDAADRNTKLTAETGTTYTGGFDETSYNRAGGAQNIRGNLSGRNDAASVNLGNNWRMPTDEEMQELIDNTNIQRATINTVYGFKFMKKSDNSVYIFLPAKTFYIGNDGGETSSYGQYWSATIAYSSDHGKYLDFAYKYNKNNVSIDTAWRRFGAVIRAVQ